MLLIAAFLKRYELKHETILNYTLPTQNFCNKLPLSDKHIS